jgi:hypothetical protein
MYIKQLKFSKTLTGKPKIEDTNGFSIATGNYGEDNTIKRLILCYEKLRNFSDEQLENWEFGAIRPIK